MTSEKSAPTVATCAGPGCGVSLEGRRPGVVYCDARCRKAAARARERVERPVPERRKAATTSRQRKGSGPERAEADAEAFRRALEAEAERDLERHPERKRFAKAASPDEHRRRGRRQPWRAES